MQARGFCSEFAPLYQRVTTTGDRNALGPLAEFITRSIAICELIRVKSPSVLDQTQAPSLSFFCAKRINSTAFLRLLP